MSASSPTTSPWTESGGLLRDPRLAAVGVRHGFTTRALGDMKEEGNRARALSAAGLSGLPALQLKQVHGTRVRAAEEPGCDGLEGDGWIASAPGRVVCVYVADCMPIFVWAPCGTAARAVGLFHSGWRGTAAGMPRAAVAAFREKLSIAPESLSVSIGPHIRSCCYRVSPELEGKFAPTSFERRGGELFLDLGKEAEGQLAASGVPAGSISVSRDCTSCSRDRLFSFRRDKQGSRMLAFAALGHGD